MTKENCEVLSPWMLYEAGALSIAAGVHQVIPFLLDVSTSDLPEAIRQHNCAAFDKEDIWQMVSTINNAIGDAATPKDVLRPLFEWRYEQFLKKELEAACKLKVSLEANKESSGKLAHSKDERTARMTLSTVKQLLDLSKNNQRILNDILKNLS